MGGLEVGQEKTRVEASHAVRRAGIVLGLLVVSVILNYVDRSNLSIAAPMLKDELGISAAQLGVLLSAFFWTYAGCQIMAGWLVDRLDVKYVFAAGFALWSGATAITGLVPGLTALLVIRVILGAGESVAYPAYSKVLARLFPEESRGFANALIASGLALGPALGLLFGGVLMARFGWRPFFIVLGAASLLWLPLWLGWMPRASARATTQAAQGPGFGELLRCRQLWAVSGCLFTANYTLYFMVTWLPYYLVRERGFSIVQMSQIGAAYFFAAALSATISGRLSDHWVRAGFTPTRVRKGFIIVAQVTGGALLIATVLAPPTVSIGLLVLAGVAFGMGASNVWVITQRLAGPKAVGRWCGVQLFCSNMSGIVVPAVTGFLVQRTGHFTAAFLLLGAVLWTGALAWMFLVGPIEPVRWKGLGGSVESLSVPE
jgi:MFS transporter, ACS family, D-galactonate transporter